jgi:hypothetical protein
VVSMSYKLSVSHFMFDGKRPPHELVTINLSTHDKTITLPQIDQTFRLSRIQFTRKVDGIILTSDGLKLVFKRDDDTTNCVNHLEAAVAKITQSKNEQSNVKSISQLESRPPKKLTTLPLNSQQKKAALQQQKQSAQLLSAKFIDPKHTRHGAIMVGNMTSPALLTPTPQKSSAVRLPDVSEQEHQAKVLSVLFFI